MRRTAHSGTIRPLPSTVGLGYRSYVKMRVITAHLKWRGAAPTRQANRKPSINGAAHQFCLTCLTSLTCLTCLTSPTNAPHQTLRQNQTAIQYWGAGLSVIPLAASDFTGSAVSGERGVVRLSPPSPLSGGGGGTPLRCSGDTCLARVWLRQM